MTFFLQTDGKENQLLTLTHERMNRLMGRHKRFTMPSRLEKWLNMGFHDSGMTGAILDLPEFVTTQASQYFEGAKAHRLPGGRMVWE